MAVHPVTARYTHGAPLQDHYHRRWHGQPIGHARII